MNSPQTGIIGRTGQHAKKEKCQLDGYADTWQY